MQAQVNIKELIWQLPGPRPLRWDVDIVSKSQPPSGIYKPRRLRRGVLAGGSLTGPPPQRVISPTLFLALPWLRGHESIDVFMLSLSPDGEPATPEPSASASSWSIFTSE